MIKKLDIFFYKFSALFFFMLSLAIFFVRYKGFAELFDRAFILVIVAVVAVAVDAGADALVTRSLLINPVWSLLLT